VQGKSLAPSLDDSLHVVHDSVYCLRGRNDHLLRTDRWALLRYGNGDIELYDMQADPHQYTNLAADLKHEKDVADLQARRDKNLTTMKKTS